MWHERQWVTMYDFLLPKNTLRVPAQPPPPPHCADTCVPVTADKASLKHTPIQCSSPLLLLFRSPVLAFI